MPDLDRSSLTVALGALGDVLAARGHECDLVLVGGAALLLRGTVSRPTKDGDIVGERLPDGSIARLDQLPPGRHLADLEALAPTADQLRSAAAWTRLRDPSPGYNELLAAVLRRLGVEEADDVAAR